MSLKTVLASSITQFWFEEIERKMWFTKDENFDELIRTRFGQVHEQASRCELFSWRETLEGRLAEIIVLDQFSRNLFRDKAESFAQDSLALGLAQEAIRDPDHKNLPAAKKAFLYMPLMHSESRIIHEQAVELFSAPGLEFNLEYEIKHKLIIDRFGRYPHRNKVLGRPSTQEEIAFLQEPNSSF